MLTRAGGGIAAVLLMLTTVACAGEQQKPPGDDSGVVVLPGRPGEPARTVSKEEAGQAVPRRNPNDADFRYVRMMITHHQQAIEMTDLAAARAVRADVKELAGRIADSQGPEIKAMNAWLTKVNAPADQGHDHGTMPGMATPDQLAALRTAGGPEFDAMFLKLMTAHHEGAMEMATDVLQTGSDVFVEEMAQEVIATQNKEIGLMKAMLQPS